MLSKMKRKLMICAMALCICAGLAGNTGAVSVWASEGSSSDAVRIGVLKGPTAMGMAQLLDEDGYFCSNPNNFKRYLSKVILCNYKNY